MFVLVSGFILSEEKPDYLILRRNMIQKQIFEKWITDKRILDAFLKVKRHKFVRPELGAKAYEDLPLEIGEGQNMDRPYIVAMMTYVIAPSFNKKVLEIGTGSGYQAAILAELVKEVYTIEKEEKLAKKAKDRLQSLGYRNIKFKTGDGALGWEDNAPFDGIICTYSPDHIPPDLKNQLAVGGRMIIPVSYSSKVHELILIERIDEKNFKNINLVEVQFVPLIRGKNEK
jgi:protein-L-isoaspartate(D-aspartate) O-methyltransferase